KARTVKTFAGAGKPGQADGAAPSFYEPGGLTIANGKLYVADTNNHAIRVVDLKTKATTTLSIKGLEPPTATAATTNDVAPNAEEISVPKQRLKPGAPAAIVVSAELPEGYHLNPSAPQRYSLVSEGLKGVFVDAGAEAQEVRRSIKGLQLPVRINYKPAVAGTGSLHVQATLFYCRTDNTGTCLIKTLVWRVPVEVASDAPANAELKLQAKLPGT
ncbi:MAG TPA: hypothetical protein VJT50_12710, partial [Pyrinomonadaceae bacterium]|nr:hypothetical protein [Pyrinomonadaceae bacterium]